MTSAFLYYYRHSKLEFSNVLLIIIRQLTLNGHIVRLALVDLGIRREERSFNVTSVVLGPSSLLPVASTPLTVSVTHDHGTVVHVGCRRDVPHDHLDWELVRVDLGLVAGQVHLLGDVFDLGDLLLRGLGRFSVVLGLASSDELQQLARFDVTIDPEPCRRALVLFIDELV